MQNKLIITTLLFGLFFTPIFSEEKPSEILKQAKKAFSQRQHKKAIELFGKYSAKNPSDGEPYFYLGFLYESQRDYRNSIEYFRKAADLKLSPKHKHTALLKIILFYDYAQAWDYVIHYSNKLLAMNPRQKDVAKLRDKAYSRKGSKSVSVKPSSISIHDTKKKSPKTKSKTETKTTDKNSKSKNVSKTKVESKEINKTKKVEKTTKSNKANKTNQSSIENQSHEKKVHEKKTSKTKIQKSKKQPPTLSEWKTAIDHIKKKEYSQADAIFTKLNGSNQSNKDYLYKAAIVKIKLNEYDKAIELLETAYPLTNEKDSQLQYYILINLGFANQKLDKLDIALKNYILADKIQSTKTFIEKLLAISYKKKDWKTSEEASDYILTKENHTLTLMYLSLSRLKQKNRQGYKPLIEFGKQIRTQYKNDSIEVEDFHEGIIELAKFYSNRQKHKLALKYLSYIRPNEKTIKRYRFISGKSHFYLANYEEAIYHLEQVEDISSALYLLSKSYSLKNDVQRAMDYLTKATKIEPKFWERSEKDKAFDDMKKDQRFNNFIRYRGKTPSSIPLNKVDSEPR